MAAGDHRLLDIRAIDEQLGHGSLVPIFRDPSDANGLAHQHAVEVVLRCHGGGWLGLAALSLRGVDAGQSDGFAAGRRAGVAVAAAFDGDGGQGRSRSNSSQQQCRHQTGCSHRHALARSHCRGFMAVNSLSGFPTS